MTQNTPPETDEQALVRWLGNLRADVAESVNGVLLRGARVVPVGATTATPFATARPAAGPGALVGFSLRNREAGPVTAYLRDGCDAAGPIVAPVQLAAGATTTHWFGPGGLNLVDGLFLDCPAGADGQKALEGAVYLRGVE